jgi:hypothetical protein
VIETVTGGKFLNASFRLPFSPGRCHHTSALVVSFRIGARGDIPAWVAVGWIRVVAVSVSAAGRRLPCPSRTCQNGAVDFDPIKKSNTNGAKMKTFSHIFTLGLAVVALCIVTGCQTVSTTNTQEIGGPIYPPSNPAQVQILRTQPTRPHVRLGEVRAEPSDENVSVAKIEEALRVAAAKMGADAAVVVYDHTQVTGAFVTGPWYGRSIQQIQGRVIIAVAIKYQ